jgi:hypothetical protein
MPAITALPPIIRVLGYGGLIPFVVLAILAQVAPSPFDFVSAESLAAYGAVICSFLGAVHWGANFRRLGNVADSAHLAETGDLGGSRWFLRNAWIWGVLPSLVAWLALQVYIPAGLLMLAAMLLVQRGIDQNTYVYYFSSPAAQTELLQMRTRLTAIASFCLTWAAVVMLVTMT